MWVTVASRFKLHKKYVYQYTAESQNGVLGTANLQNVPKVTCQVKKKNVCVSFWEKQSSYLNPSGVIILQVEIEVPQMCRFIMHTRDCTLSEVSFMDPQGHPVFERAPGSDAFKASMEKSVLNGVHTM